MNSRFRLAVLALATVIGKPRNAAFSIYQIDISRLGYEPFLISRFGASHGYRTTAVRSVTNYQIDISRWGTSRFRLAVLALATVIAQLRYAALLTIKSTSAVGAQAIFD